MEKRTYIFPILIGLAFAIFYMAFPTKVHFIDGLGFAYDLENFPISYDFHQHHPLWLPLTHILFHSIKVIAPSLRSLDFLIVLNSILGGLTIFLFIRLVHKAVGNKIASIMAGLFLGVTWGMMTNSTDANIYIVMILMMIGITIILLDGTQLTRKRALLATGLIIFACLIHQMCIFFTPVILAAILLRSPKRQRNATAIICTAMFAIVISAANYTIYLHATSLAVNEIEITFMQWLTAFGHHPTWWTVQLKGFARAQEIFIFTQMNLFIHTYGCELMHHAKGYGAAQIGTLSLIIHIIIVTSILYEIVSFFKVKENDLLIHHTRILMIIWILPFFIFNVFYCAFEVHYKLFYLLPLIVLWMIRLIRLRREYQKTISSAICVLIVLLGIWNFTSGVLPNTKPESNPFFNEVLEIAQVVKKSDLVIFSNHQAYTSFLARYYTNADTTTFKKGYSPFAVLDKSEMAIDKKTIEFLNTRYKRIFLTDDAYRRIPNHLYFPERRIPPPHSWLLSLDASSIIPVNAVKSNGRIILYEVKLLSDT